MKRIIIGAAAIGTAISVAAPANATAILFNATTKGCFNSASCTPVASPSGTVTDDYLKFTSGTVSNLSDVTGHLVVGGYPDNFGWFQLGTTVDTSYAGD